MKILWFLGFFIFPIEEQDSKELVLIPCSQFMTKTWLCRSLNYFPSFLIFFSGTQREKNPAHEAGVPVAVP